MYIYLTSELIIHKSHKLVDNITEEAVLDSSQWSSAKLKGIFLKLYLKKTNYHGHKRQIVDKEKNIF